MAKMGLALICLLVVLATFAQFDLGSTQNPPQIGRFISFSNNAANLVSKLSTTVFNDGSSKTDPGFSVLRNGQTVVPVPADVACVQTSFEMADPTPPFPDARFHQIITDWCTTNMAVNCLPDCYWTIDNEGFYVASSAMAPPQLVAIWEGPDD